jgi:hypothetical protein
MRAPRLIYTPPLRVVGLDGVRAGNDTTTGLAALHRELIVAHTSDGFAPRAPLGSLRRRG